MVEESKYMDLSNMASMPYGPFQPGSGFGVYDNFVDDFGLEDFSNQQNKDRVEMAAWQIQKARGLDSVSLREVASLITPYGPGLSVDQLLEVMDEYPGISVGLNLQTDGDILEDADMLYGDKAFNQAYNYLETESKANNIDPREQFQHMSTGGDTIAGAVGGGLDSLSESIGSGLDSFANWIGKKVYEPLKNTFTTSPEERFQLSAQKENPPQRSFAKDLEFGSSFSIPTGGEFEGDEEAAIEGYLFGKNLYSATANAITNQKNTIELDRETLLAEAQLAKTGTVRNDTASNIAALTTNMASMESNEQIGLILDDIFAEEGAISLQNYISDRSNYDNGELSQDAVREWLGNLGTDVGTTGAAFDTYVGLQQGFDSAFPMVSTRGGGDGSTMSTPTPIPVPTPTPAPTAIPWNPVPLGPPTPPTATAPTTPPWNPVPLGPPTPPTATAPTTPPWNPVPLGPSTPPTATAPTTPTPTPTPAPPTANKDRDRQPGEEGFIPKNMDEWKLDDQLKRLQREEQATLLDNYDTLQDDETVDVPLAPMPQDGMGGNVIGPTVPDDGSVNIAPMPSEQVNINPYQEQFGQGPVAINEEDYRDIGDTYTPSQQFRQYALAGTPAGSQLRNAVFGMQNPLLQQYYLTAEGMDPRYGGAGERRSFSDFMTGPQLTGQQIRDLAQETTGYLGRTPVEILNAFGQGMTDPELARVSSLQKTYGGEAGAKNRLGLTQALATRRGSGGFYGGNLGQAINSSLAELQAAYQAQNPFGGDAGNFLNYYLQQTNRNPQTQMGGI